MSITDERNVTALKKRLWLLERGKASRVDGL